MKMEDENIQIYIHPLQSYSPANNFFYAKEILNDVPILTITKTFCMKKSLRTDTQNPGTLNILKSFSTWVVFLTCFRRSHGDYKKYAEITRAQYYFNSFVPTSC